MCAIHSLRVDGVVAAPLTIRNDVSIGTTSRGDGGLLGKLLSDLACIVLVDTGGKQELLPSLDVGSTIAVLIWVGGFVFEDLDELVEAGSNNGTKDRSNPVDPVVIGKGVVDDCWAEGSSRVEGSTGKVDAGQLGDEERKTDA